MTGCNWLFWLAGLVLCAAALQADSHDDLGGKLERLKDSAKHFRKPFRSALKDSSQGSEGASRKAAEKIADQFANQTQDLVEAHKRGEALDTRLTAAEATAQQLRTMVTGYRLNGRVVARWQEVEGYLRDATAVVGASATNAAARGGDLPCFRSAGAESAERLVQQCRQVSPATHPPCNAQNSCAMIIDEIKRSCELLKGTGAPAFCTQY